MHCSCQPPGNEGVCNDNHLQSKATVKCLRLFLMIHGLLLSPFCCLCPNIINPYQQATVNFTQTFDFEIGDGRSNATSPVREWQPSGPMHTTRIHRSPWYKLFLSAAEAFNRYLVYSRWTRLSFCLSQRCPQSSRGLGTHKMSYLHCQIVCDSCQKRHICYSFPGVVGTTWVRR